MQNPMVDILSHLIGSFSLLLCTQCSLQHSSYETSFYMQLCVESSPIPSLPPSLSLLVCFTNHASLQYEKQGYAESVHVL